MHYKISVLCLTLLSMGLVACNSDDKDQVVMTPPVVEEATPKTISLSLLGRYETGVMNESAAEIPAYDARTQRVFVVNAKKGMLDVLDLSQPASPRHIAELSARDYLPGSEINSVAVSNGIVAAAVQAANKTDPGKVVFFDSKTLAYISQVQVGALPDMLTFSPDGKMLLVANEGEPNDDYSIDPEGSVSLIDVSNIQQPQSTELGFSAWNDRKAELIAAGVRIFGPHASVAQDLEPEYIAISEDSKTAWVSLQENNALAKIDLQAKKITDILPLGFKDHGLQQNALDVSDRDLDGKTGKINIQAWPGLMGMYQPDSIASYQVKGRNYVVTANEGDSREWLRDEKAYYAGQSQAGYVEQIRMKHLFNAKGFNQKGDYPAHLQQLAPGIRGAKLDPSVFAYCGATTQAPGACRDDLNLGRLTIAWNMGYDTDANGQPQLDANGFLNYKNIYAYGARSFSIWDDQGRLVWDSGSEFERKLAELFPAQFNSDHGKVAFDDRSDNKGPEPEGIAIGKIGNKTFAFIGLERMSGIMLYDISQPTQPVFIEYMTTRDFNAADPLKQGDLGPEGLSFVSAKDAPDGKPLLIVGNEVSGSTAIYQINLKY